MLETPETPCQNTIAMILLRLVSNKYNKMCILPDISDDLIDKD